MQLGVVAHSYNPSIQAEAEDLEFQASVGYISERKKEEGRGKKGRELLYVEILGMGVQEEKRELGQSCT
jgi:hypothetical protein